MIGKEYQRVGINQFCETRHFFFFGRGSSSDLGPGVGGAKLVRWIDSIVFRVGRRGMAAVAVASQTLKVPVGIRKAIKTGER